MSRISDMLTESEFFDDSYPSSEQQLLWRIEDLKLRQEYCTCSDSAPMTQADLLYALPECFDNPYDIERAIALAEEKLLIDCRSDIREKEEHAAEPLKSVPLPAA